MIINNLNPELSNEQIEAIAKAFLQYFSINDIKEYINNHPLEYEKFLKEEENKNC